MAYSKSNKVMRFIGLFTLVTAVLCSCDKTKMENMRTAEGASTTPVSDPNNVRLSLSATAAIARSLSIENVASSTGSFQEETDAPNQLAVIQSDNRQREACVSSIAKAPLDIRQRIFDDTVRHNLLHRVAFGKASWAQYFGDIGESPALPHDIHAILKSPCPFWAGRMVYETHLLVLIPACINGCPFSLNLLGKLIQNPQGDGNETQYRLYSSVVRSQLGAASPDRSYWVLLTRNVLAGSRNTSYAAQKTLVAGYALPSVLAAATAILMHHVRTGERLFTDVPWTYIRSRDQINWNGALYPALVGGFSTRGLLVSEDGFDSICLGVAGCRKF